jgi:hypothetical protein
MASNSRSGGSKKGPTKGSGGKNRRSLRGKGPTPKAEDRVYHKAYRAAQNRKNQNASAQAKRKKREHGPNMVAGRNSVLEALREGVPATTMYVAGRIDSDDRVRESITLAAQRGISMLEASRPDLDSTSPTTRSTRASLCRSRRTSTRRRPICSNTPPTGPRRRCWSPSTGSPIRATSARSCARRRPSAVTG